MRLFNELSVSKALEQQTATSEVLQVISSSPGELEPVFQAMLENAVRICGAKFGNLLLREGIFPSSRCTARRRNSSRCGGANRSFRRRPGTGLAAYCKPSSWRRSPTSPSAAYADAEPRSSQESLGVRTQLTVPMLKDDEVVGAIGIYRQEVRPFTDKQIELVAISPGRR